MPIASAASVTSRRRNGCARSRSRPGTLRRTRAALQGTRLVSLRKSPKAGKKLVATFLIQRRPMQSTHVSKGNYGNHWKEMPRRAKSHGLRSRHARAKSQGLRSRHARAIWKSTATATTPSTTTTKTTHFGAAGYQDFTVHKDKDRKRRYLARHCARENFDDFTTAGSLSRWILWNKPSLRASVADYRKRFGV